MPPDASPHSTLDEIKREMNAPLPNDRVGGLLTLEQERWLVEQFEMLREAAQDFVTATGQFNPERYDHTRNRLEAVLHDSIPAKRPHS